MASSAGSRPTLSVVIPTFNRAQVLPRAIASVLAQSLADFEVIVVDDGSTDDTDDLLAAFRDNRVRVIRQENRGVSAARNAGVQASRGSVITFLDSDDEADERWLERIVAPFADPEVDLVCCGVRFGSDVVRLPESVSWADEQVQLLPGTFALRRDLFDQIGGYLEGLPYAENTELGMRLVSGARARRHRLVAIHEPLITMHRELSGDSAPHRAEAILRVANQPGGTLQQRPRQLAQWLAIAGVDRARAGDLKDARALFRRAWRADPLRLRHMARLAVACVPVVARHVWTREGPDASAEAVP